MGLVPAAPWQTSTWRLARCLGDSANGVFSAAGMKKVNMSDIIASVGLRVPDNSSSQIAFRALSVVSQIVRWRRPRVEVRRGRCRLLAGRPSTKGVVNFHSATGGRASMSMEWRARRRADPPAFTGSRFHAASVGHVVLFQATASGVPAPSFDGSAKPAGQST